MKKNQRGFTLLELLVVISIMGILMVLGATSYTTAQKKGRDARRKADVKAISAALEQYYSVNGSYGTCATSEFDDYLSGAVPTDPKGGNYTVSCATSPSIKFCVCTGTGTAALEGTGNASSVLNGVCTFVTNPTPNNAPYFCVASQQ